MAEVLSLKLDDVGKLPVLSSFRRSVPIDKQALTNVQIEEPQIEEPQKVTLHENPKQTAKEVCEEIKTVIDETKRLRLIAHNKELREMDDDDLAEIDAKKYSGQYLYVRLDHIYDGDTFDVVFYDRQMHAFTRIRCRAYGYDAPEMKVGKSVPDRNAIIRAAKAARAELVEWSRGGEYICTVVEHKTKRTRAKDKREKFGRMLVNVYKFQAGRFDNVLPEDIENFADELTAENSLCQYMLENTKSKEYYGGTK